MSEASIEVILSQAKAEERKHGWLAAADCYAMAASAVSAEDRFELAGVFESEGYASYRSAMQAENSEEFKTRCSRAVKCYEKASQLCLKSDRPGQKPRMIRCTAMIAYINYWLESEVAKKRVHANECWRLTKKALDTFEKLGEGFEFRKTYNQLVDSAFFAFFLEWDFYVRERIAKEAMDFGERAIKLLSKSADVYEQANMHAKALVCITVFAYNFLDVSDREREYEKASVHWSKAKELNEEAAVLEILHPFFGPNIIFGVEGTEEAIRNFAQALRLALRTRDRFLIGSAFDWLTYHAAWQRVREEYDKQLELTEEAIEYARKAKEAFSPIAFTSPRDDLAWIEDAPQVARVRAPNNETDLHKKRDMLDEAIEAAPSMMKRAADSGYPEIMMYGHHIYSYMLTELSQLETSREERKRLLDEALWHRNESLKINSQIQPFMYWNRGVNHKLKATVRSEIADLTDDPEMKKTIMHEAITDSNASLELKNKDLVFYKSKGSTEALTANIAENQFLHGNLLTQLYDLTKEKVDLHKALQSYEKSLAGYQGLGIMSRVAECHWKMARVYDSVAEHLRSAESFRLASISYGEAMTKIPQLKEFYEEHSTYVLSWSEIEKARDNHRKQKYGEARKHFEKAAQLHKGLRQWRYLEPNYLAWALVEQGEELSRKDKTDEALRRFERAAAMFIETEKSIKAHLPSVEDPEERTMATNVLKGSNQRHQYCLARASLEEARLLDKKGDHSASSDKYGIAVKSLEKIETELEYEHDRREFKFLILVSRAWEKMMRAEAEASPRLYREAATYFEDANEFSSNEKSGLLVLGHGQICKALEAGMKLTHKMDRKLYNAARSFLENAASYYQRAGFHEAIEYAKATELLFDAHYIIDSAKKEHNPNKKATQYMMAEKALQSSAGSFKKARHFEKQKQVTELLKRVREVREVATSLAPLLSASGIVSTRTALTVPTPTYEEPVGLERFEHAEIRANVSARKRQLTVGENLVLEIELVNAGKGHALLTKIKGVVPEGFELMGKPEHIQREDGSLNLKGKKLNSLETEEIRLVLRPKAQGAFSLDPMIFYLDEDGKYRTHETDPIKLKVKESVTEPSEGRSSLVDTGFEPLDRLLYGGLAPNSAVILTSAFADERASLISSFLETGVKRAQTTFYVITKASGLTALAEKHQTSFYLFICNPQADAVIGDMPNVFKLKGTENLTEINIALSTALNRLPIPPDDHRRACIEIVSDVLLQHEAPHTRRWLTALIPQLKSKGFTILAAIDPEMHLSKDVHAVLDIFDGEISIYEKETGKKSARFLRILRMLDQEYLEEELALGKKRVHRSE
jgi:tetratricopeptide (TPR) repeat protein/KaiC/GvpD/RAD55 family RecA-like ATPase